MAPSNEPEPPIDDPLPDPHIAIRWQAETIVRSHLRAQRGAEFDEPDIGRISLTFGEDAFDGWSIRGIVHEPNEAGVLIARDYVLFADEGPAGLAPFGLEITGRDVPRSPRFARWLEFGLLVLGNTSELPTALATRVAAARQAARNYVGSSHPIAKEIPPPGSKLVDRWEIRRPTADTWTIRGSFRSREGRVHEILLDLDDPTYAPRRYRLDDLWILGGPYTK